MLDGLPLVMAERVQLQQVLLNLIMNAIEAMRSVTDRDKVLSVSSMVCEADQVLITLKDSALELIRLTWIASLTLSLRRGIVAWGWAFRFAARSLNLMAGSSGPRHTVPMERFFT
jgi:hypothetical protein